jgi:hypothetical protein
MMGIYHLLKNLLEILEHMQAESYKLRDVVLRNYILKRSHPVYEDFNRDDGIVLVVVLHDLMTEIKDVTIEELHGFKAGTLEDELQD